MRNILPSVELEWKITWEDPGALQREPGKMTEQTYSTPFLGYPYYSNHDDLTVHPYHNDDCP